MTGVAVDFGPTGRLTGRVVTSEAVSPVQRRVGLASAPEGMAAASPTPLLPEGGRRLSRGRLSRLRDALSERDWAVLDLVNQHRFLTTAHIFELLFADHATDQSGQRCCRRVLARLVRDRVLEHLERRIGGVRAGSASYVFRVGLTGDQLLRLRAGEGSRARRKEPSARHLDHCLAVADCHVTLQRLARTSGTELLRAETEPRCWREFSDLGGTPQILKPDLYAVTASDEFEDHWFLEVDRATESLPTVLRQCSAYQLYRDSGAEQARLGLFPRVLWSVPTPARARAITEAVRRQARLDAGLFRVLTLDQLPAVIGEGAA